MAFFTHKPLGVGSVARVRTGCRLACALGWVCGWLMLGLGSVFAQKMEVDAPVIDFKLPLFDRAKGFKEWEIAGHEGRYIDRENIVVLLATIKRFGEDKKEAPFYVISSPEARINLRTRTAEGDSTLRLQGHNYRVRGSDWTFNGRDNRLVVNRDARVEFAQSLGKLIE